VDEKHIATWVYYTYRDHKDLPKWLEKDLDHAKEVLGVPTTPSLTVEEVRAWLETENLNYFQNDA